MGSPGGVQIGLLGGFTAQVDGAPVEGWRLRKAKALVKLLALAPGHRLHRDVLADELWPDAEPTAQANNLHQALHAARRALHAGNGPGVLALADDVVSLDPEVTVDVDAFERLAERARASRTLDDLRAAVAMYTGDLLPEDQYADWALAHRDRLQHQHAALVVALADALLGRRDVDEAVAALRPLATARPTDEVVHRALMRALAAAGQRWEATAVYDDLRARLDDELAAEPAEQTRALYRELLAGGVAPHASTGRMLPAPTTSFVGRTRALEDLAAVLGRTRLVTLSGPGGAGKTRLALELASRPGVAARYPDGVRFGALADVRDEALVLSTVAAAVGVVLSGRDPDPRTLAAQIRDRRLLLVIDNCEHLRAECARLVTVLLADCPDLQLVTTSREPLGVPGEVNWRVPSLDLPDVAVPIDVAALSRLEAVQLFVDRAREAMPGFELTPETAGPVAMICRRLDGIPLALELAAARLAHLSVGDIAVRLDDSLTLLGHRSPGRLDRQQTLGATLDWSHELLDAQEQAAFRQLAVFAGGFDLAAFDHVCRLDADHVLVLSRLVDKSLVVADTSGATARYRTLEVVRQYAAQRLAATPDAVAAQLRHLEWFAASAAERDPEHGGFTVETAEWFARERDNLRAALATALHSHPALALPLAVSVWRWWMCTGLFAEGRRWLGLALDAADGAPQVRARALLGCAVFDARMARSERMSDYADQVVALGRAAGPREEVRALSQRVLIGWACGEWPRAAQRADEARTIAERRGAVADLASLVHLQALIALSRGSHTAALARVDECLTILDEVPPSAGSFFATGTVGHCVDDISPVPLVIFEETLLLGRQTQREAARGHALYTRAWALRELRAWDLAMAAAQDSRAAFARARDPDGEAMALARAGNTARAAGDLALARRLLESSMELRQQLRDVRGIGLCLCGLALAAGAGGDRDAARVSIQGAADLLGSTGDRAGWGATYTITAGVELLAGDIVAAAAATGQGIAQTQGPGGHRGSAWLTLSHAACLLELGRLEEAGPPLEAAQVEFARLGADPALRRARAVAKRLQSGRP